MSTQRTESTRYERADVLVRRCPLCGGGVEELFYGLDEDGDTDD